MKPRDSFTNSYIRTEDVTTNGSAPVAVGSYGAVYQATWMHKTVIVKELMNIDNLQLFKREIRLWGSARHPNVVQFLGANDRQPPFFVVSKLATEGTLPEYLSRVNKPVVWRKLYEVAAGLKYLHSLEIVHGDLKGNNIVVDQDGTAMLTDFGLSFLSAGSRPPQQNLGAMRWRAPEYARPIDTPPSFPSDIYSLGMCIVEAVTGAKPWGSLDDQAVIYNLQNGIRLPTPAALTPKQWRLVEGMIALQPKDRTSLVDVLGRLKDLAEDEEYDESQLSVAGNVSEHSANQCDEQEAILADLREGCAAMYALVQRCMDNRDMGNYLFSHSNDCAQALLEPKSAYYWYVSRQTKNAMTVFFSAPESDSFLKLLRARGDLQCLADTLKLLIRQAKKAVRWFELSLNAQGVRQDNLARRWFYFRRAMVWIEHLRTTCKQLETKAANARISDRLSGLAIISDKFDNYFPRTAYRYPTSAGAYKQFMRHVLNDKFDGEEEEPFYFASGDPVFDWLDDNYNDHRGVYFALFAPSSATRAEEYLYLQWRAKVDAVQLVVKNRSSEGPLCRFTVHGVAYDEIVDGDQYQVAEVRVDTQPFAGGRQRFTVERPYEFLAGKEFVFYCKDGQRGKIIHAPKRTSGVKYGSRSLDVFGSRFYFAYVDQQTVHVRNVQQNQLLHGKRHDNNGMPGYAYVWETQTGKSWQLQQNNGKLSLKNSSTGLYLGWHKRDGVVLFGNAGSWESFRLVVTN